MAFEYDNSDFDLNLADRDSCVAFIEASLEPYPSITLPLDAHVRLELGAGKDADGTKVYRPYAYLASVLSRAVNTAHLNSGSAGPVSGEFREADKAIAGWRQDQLDCDAGLGLTVPPSGAGSGSVPRTTSVPIVNRF